MKKLKISFAVSFLVALCANAFSYEVQAYKFKIDANGLSAVNVRAGETDALNIMAAGAVKRAISFKDESSKRGVAEASIYQKVSAGTVLIATEGGLGSGAVITNNGMILTNHHVVGDAQKVKVFFKPVSGFNDLQKAVEVFGTVLKVNTKNDLALVKVEGIPSGVRPIPIKFEAPPAIGEDAHAVGHPRGEVWSYTRGYVSQYRSQYQWTVGKDGASYAADVIQTQTPINPGNSGGPLVDSEGRLIGLNSFGDPKSPGLNFAVASSTIQKFLQQDGSVKEKSKSAVSQKQVSSEGPCGKDPIGQKVDEWNNGTATWVFFDPFCKGKATLVKIIPQNPKDPVFFMVADPDGGKMIIGLIDYDRDGKIDKTLVDYDGDGYWDASGMNKAGETFASDISPIKKG